MPDGSTVPDGEYLEKHHPHPIVIVTNTLMHFNRIRAARRTKAGFIEEGVKILKKYDVQYMDLGGKLLIDDNENIDYDRHPERSIIHEHIHKGDPAILFRPGGNCTLYTQGGAAGRGLFDSPGASGAGGTHGSGTPGGTPGGGGTPGSGGIPTFTGFGGTTPGSSGGSSGGSGGARSSARSSGGDLSSPFNFPEGSPEGSHVEGATRLTDHFPNLLKSSPK